MRDEVAQRAADRFERFDERGTVSEFGQSVDFKEKEAALGVEDEIGA